MSDEEKKCPPWLTSARRDIRQTRQDWDLALSEGQADIRRGLEVTRIAEKKIGELDYLDRTLNQDIPLSIWNDETIGVTGRNLAGTLSTYGVVVEDVSRLYIDFGREKQEQHDLFLQAAKITAVTSGSMFYMGAEIEQRIQFQWPEYEPALEEVRFEYVGSREQDFDELHNLLNENEYDPRYAQMLRGSEEALEKEGPDRLSQAAHSMRDLFDQIIRSLAPSEVVRKQPWFGPEPQARGGVSRWIRLRYILYGSGMHYEKNELLQLDKAARGAKDALDLCIARAHNHDPELTKKEVQLAIDHARFYLKSVLQKYKERRGGNPKE